MEAAQPDRVYKASERAGVGRFEPRPYWRLDDFSRSGSAADPAKVPAGATVFHGVYATRASFVPFYFAPRPVPRFSIDPEVHPAGRPVLEHWLGGLPSPSPRLIVFAETDRAALAAFEFSVYAFDAEPFRRLPTGEFLAEFAVTPLDETRRRDALAALAGAGWVVRFVNSADAIRRLRMELQAVGVKRFSAEKL